MEVDNIPIGEIIPYDKNPRKNEINRKHRLKYIDRYRQKDRLRYLNNKEKMKEDAKIYYQKNKDKILKQHKEKTSELSRKAHEEYHTNPIRRKKTIIRSQTKKEWERGNIIKESCDNCGSKENLNFHHENYKNWKNFKVLCKECHLKEHQKIGYKIPLDINNAN